MCKGAAWAYWRRELERARQQKAGELKNQGKTAAPPKLPAPANRRPDPVPA